MPLQFNCVHCGKEIFVQYLKPGEMAKCPHCGQTTPVPSTAEEAGTVPEIKKDDSGNLFNALRMPSTSQEALENIDALNARPLESIAKPAVILGWMVIPFVVILLISSLMQYSLFADIVNGNGENLYDKAAANDTRQGILSLLLILMEIPFSIIFLIWFYRAHRNLRYAKVPGLKYASGWTIGGFLVPIMNFFRPYQMMAETWRGSAAMSGACSYEEWINHPSCKKARWWWGLTLIAIPINLTDSYLLRFSDYAEDLMLATLLSIISLCLAVSTLIMLIYLIKEITAHQSNARKIALVRSKA